MILVLVGCGVVAVPDTAAADAVTDWNVTMVEAQTIAKTPGPVGTRQGAIVAAAVFDAVNGIRPRFQSIHVQPGAPRHASSEAAAAAAAHDTLVALILDQQALFDTRLVETLATLPGDDRSINAGLAWGTSVAAGILAWRADDGSAAVLPPYVIGTDPGDWQPTPPAFALTPRSARWGCRRRSACARSRSSGPPFTAAGERRDTPRPSTR